VWRLRQTSALTTCVKRLWNVFLLAWLRQLRRVRRSLDVESVKTKIVHAFVVSGVDYCNSFWGVSVPKWFKLQSVLNTAAHLITGTHVWFFIANAWWPPLADCSSDGAVYKLAVTVHRCLQHRAPRYLAVADYDSKVSARQHLRSARRRRLSVPRVRRSTRESRAFSVAGPTVWNSLPVD